MPTQNPQMGARIPPRDFERIQELVRSGEFASPSDFIRRAVSEKLAREAKAS